MSCPDTNVGQGIEAVLTRIRHTIDVVGNQFPHWANTVNGEWTATPDGDWTGGAWVGELWLAARVTGHKEFIEAANRWQFNGDASPP